MMWSKRISLLFFLAFVSSSHAQRDTAELVGVGVVCGGVVVIICIVWVAICYGHWNIERDTFKIKKRLQQRAEQHQQYRERQLQQYHQQRQDRERTNRAPQISAPPQPLTPQADRRYKATVLSALSESRSMEFTDSLRVQRARVQPSRTSVVGTAEQQLFFSSPNSQSQNAQTSQLQQMPQSPRHVSNTSLQTHQQSRVQSPGNSAANFSVPAITVEVSDNESIMSTMTSRSTNTTHRRSYDQIPSSRAGGGRGHGMEGIQPPRIPQSKSLDMSHRLQVNADPRSVHQPAPSSANPRSVHQPAPSSANPRSVHQPAPSSANPRSVHQPAPSSANPRSVHQQQEQRIAPAGRRAAPEMKAQPQATRQGNVQGNNLLQYQQEPRPQVTQSARVVLGYFPKSLREEEEMDLEQDSSPPRYSWLFSGKKKKLSQNERAAAHNFRSPPHTSSQRQDMTVFGQLTSWPQLA